MKPAPRPEQQPPARETDDFTDLIGKIARLPDIPCPPMSSRVLGRLKPVHRPLRYRLRRFLCTPQTLTLTPVRWLAAATLALLVAGAGILVLPSGQGPARVENTPQKVVLRFSLHWPSAHSVHLIGTFNHWDPQGYAMKRAPAGGRWVLQVPVDPGRYAYAFLVDRQHVVTDPEAVFSQTDGFGAKSAVILAISDEDRRI